jgi:p-cumate 2,3-dioxygenase beta subunit
MSVIADERASVRAEVEEFLYREAALLDDWRLDDWLALLTDDAVYRVPPNDRPAGNHQDTLFLIADDIQRIRARVKRLNDANAHAEYPRSRTRRLIGNVRIVERTAASVRVLSNFVVYRFRRDERIREYVGHYEHVLVAASGTFKIASRTAYIDAMELGSLGSVSFIL